MTTKAKTGAYWVGIAMLVLGLFGFLNAVFASKADLAKVDGRVDTLEERQGNQYEALRERMDLMLKATGVPIPKE